MGKTIALVFAVMFLSTVFIFSNFANAEQSNDSNFTSKGKTEYSSHFPGMFKELYGDDWNTVAEQKSKFEEQLP